MRCNSILIVEDNESIRDSIIEVLRAEGYDPDHADNGKEALSKLNKLVKPCLVLLDIHMPKMDGFAFLKELRRSGLEKVAHVIVVTAMTHIDVGGIRVIKKPFDLEELILAVDGICGEIKNRPKDKDGIILQWKPSSA